MTDTDHIHLTFAGIVESFGQLYSQPRDLADLAGRYVFEINGHRIELDVERITKTHTCRHCDGEGRAAGATCSDPYWPCSNGVAEEVRCHECCEWIGLDGDDPHGRSLYWSDGHYHCGACMAEFVEVRS